MMNVTLGTICALLSPVLLAGPALSQASTTSHAAFEQHRAMPDPSFPSEPTRAVAIDASGAVLAATDSGVLFARTEEDFAPLDSTLRASRTTTALASRGSFLYFTISAYTSAASGDQGQHGLLFASGAGGPERRLADLPSPVHDIAVSDGLPAELFLASETGLLHFQDGTLRHVPLDEAGAIHEVAVSVAHPYASGRRMIAVAAQYGLFVFGSQAVPDEWIRLAPRSDDGSRSWSPSEVRTVLFDSSQRLWFGSRQGIGVYDFTRSSWRLLTPNEGLPFADFTASAAGHHDDVWLGTTSGLIHLTLGTERDVRPLWEVRRGRRWLPDDLVHDIAVSEDGNVWIGTEGGLARIELALTSLQQKAELYETDIHRYHRRTEFGFVDGVQLARAGDRSTATRHPSDNDGLWTAMYGAAQCFAWAATGNEQARARAQQAFEALRFLSTVTQGGDHPAPRGFPARSILEIDAPDPNVGLVERDIERRREHDRQWKVIDPRWPISADGRWYWKSDTSSDELDGHYFFYALYYDLVAGPEEKPVVARVVTEITDHLIDHDFSLVDHTSTATRWGVFGPEALNHDKSWWEERGLNSLSMLAYLRIAEHVSGERRYAEVARSLIDEHAYAANARQPKVQQGPGTGNQSDDEMAMMGFYHLLRYEQDPRLRELWAHSLRRYFDLLLPERNPFFDYVVLAAVDNHSYEDAFDSGLLLSQDIRQEALADALDSLRRFSLDLVDWRIENSQRLDVDLLPGTDPEAPRGHLRDGKVLPIDERYVHHWNHDPWQLDQGGPRDHDGYRLADGASYLLAYYMGLYHGFIDWQPP